MNVRNEPFHDMACVVKRETPPELRWKFGQLQKNKRISDSGINLMGGGGEFQCRGFHFYNYHICIKIHFLFSPFFRRTFRMPCGLLGSNVSMCACF